MVAWVGSERMEKAGIHSPTELLSFPWDMKTEETPSVNISQEEIERMREEMRRINESHTYLMHM